MEEEKGCKTRDKKTGKCLDKEVHPLFKESHRREVMGNKLFEHIRKMKDDNWDIIFAGSELKFPFDPKEIVKEMEEEDENITFQKDLNINITIDKETPDIFDVGWVGASSDNLEEEIKYIQEERVLDSIRIPKDLTDTQKIRYLNKRFKEKYKFDETYFDVEHY